MFFLLARSALPVEEQRYLDALEVFAKKALVVGQGGSNEHGRYVRSTSQLDFDQTAVPPIDV